MLSLGKECQCPLCDLDRLFQLTKESEPEKLKYEFEEAVELLNEAREYTWHDGVKWTDKESRWHNRVRKFLEGK